MERLHSHIDTSSAEFRANRDRMQSLMAEYRARLEQIRQGGGPKYLARHREQGKLPVRERIEGLLDPGSAFLELSPLAAWDMYDGDAPSAGVVTMRSQRRTKAMNRVCPSLGRSLLPETGTRAKASTSIPAIRAITAMTWIAFR